MCMSAERSEGEDPTLDDFVVQTKPRNVQDALWRIVYDNDYFPQNAACGTERTAPSTAWKQPWTPRAGQNGWQTAQRPNVHFNNSERRRRIYSSMPKPIHRQQSLTDWLAYDVTVNQGPDASARCIRAAGLYDSRRQCLAM